MIRIFTGTVGSGKSYHAVEVCLRKLSAIRNNYVIANFPLKFNKSQIKRGYDKRFIYLDDSEIKVRNFIKIAVEKNFLGKENSCLIVLDEAGIYFNSRDWQRQKDRFLWIKFFTQSRKLGYDIILIAQSKTMIDKQVRECAEYEVKHVKLRNYIWFQLLPVQVFAAVSYWSGGRFNGTMELVLYKPWVAKKYDTMRIFGSDEIKRALDDFKSQEPAAGEAGAGHVIKMEKDTNLFIQKKKKVIK